MSPGRLRFGTFELDTRAGELWRGRRRIRLQDKPLKLLLALVERPYHVVTREELRARLWPTNVIVEFDNGLNNAVSRLRHALGDSPDSPKYVETVGRRGYRFIGTILPETVGPDPDATDDRPRVRSIAVLPLENLSNDPDQEYFSDGMSDALISRLAGIRSLHVISRQSVMRYKRSATPMPQIARELGIDGAVEGTVLRSSERVRVSVQLIHAPTDRHLWSAQYERRLGDVIALQSAIAADVAEQIRTAVTDEESARLARSDAVDPRAYDLYLRGRFFWAQRSDAGLRRSLDYFRRALEIDPGFADAHSAIAAAYGPLGYLGFMPPDEATPNMRGAALRALQLDPENVEGLAVRGACAAFHEWQLAEAERYFLRALDMSASYAMAHGWYGLLLENTGRQPENLRERQRAFELSPLWVATGIALGSALYFNGRADEGIAMIERTLELEPDLPYALRSLGTLYEATGRISDAVDVLERAGVNGELGHAYALAGRRKEARDVLAALEKQARRGYVAPRSFALVHAGLGNTAEAMDWLEHGVEIRDPSMSGIKVDPRFVPLADEPRFLRILGRMGLTSAPADMSPTSAGRRPPPLG